MEVRQIKDREIWEKFVIGQPYTLFVQSWNYGEFYKKMGEEFWVFGIYEGSELIGGSLVVSTHAKRGDFLYLPYGPVLSADFQKTSSKNRKEAFQVLTNKLKEFAKQNHYDFIRVSPFDDDCKKCVEFFKKAGYRNAPMHVLAETTWILGLEDKTEDELLMQMNKNHRNLIRRCIKEGVKIEKLSGENVDLSKFNKLHDETAKRHNFHRFSNKYVKNEFEVFAKDKSAVVYYAYLPDGTLDSSAVVMYYGKMAAYRHGASLMINKKIPTSYLIQWEAIKEAQKRGIKWYNFWGIAPDDAPKTHPFKGITHFKKGFGGKQKDLLHCQDLPVSYRYWFNWIVETTRRIRRGF